MYTFLESDVKNINLLVRCKQDKEKKTVVTKKYTRKLLTQKQNVVEDEPYTVLKRICKIKFPNHSENRICAYLNVIIDDPPKENCSLHKKFYEKNENNIFKKHNIICYMLHFIDCDTLMKYKNCSKIDYEIVSLYLKKILYNLPFQHEGAKTNFQHWSNVVSHFFYRCGSLKPLDRNVHCPSVVQALQQNSSFCVITDDSMHSTVFISLDYLNEKLISRCDHFKPLPHTCDPAKEIQGIKNVKSQEITLTDFVEEYYKRLQINDDEIIWNIYGFRKSKKLLALLFLEYLKCMNHVIKKYNGSSVFKKTEYLVNCGHHITHRIWIQIFYEYKSQCSEKKKKKEEIANDEMSTLYLTIADHYKWDA